VRVRDRVKQAGYSRKHYVNNKEKVIAAAAEWAAQNPEKRRTTQRTQKDASAVRQADAAFAKMFPNGINQGEDSP